MAPRGVILEIFEGFLEVARDCHGTGDENGKHNNSKVESAKTYGLFFKTGKVFKRVKWDCKGQS